MGCVSDPGFHQCSRLAKVLTDAGAEVDINSGDMHETQFEEYLSKAKTRIGGNIFEVSQLYLELER